MPPRPDDAKLDALALAAEELVAAASEQRAHPADVRFGVHVVELLADAAAQISVVAEPE